MNTNNRRYNLVHMGLAKYAGEFSYVLIGLLLLAFITPAFADEEEGKATDASKPADETYWIGTFQRVGTSDVELVSGGKRYSITGFIEQELLKEAGKEMKVTGRLSGNESIEVSKAEPVVVKR